MSLTALSKEIRFDNASKGFDPTEGGVGRYLLLAISEICEAQNDLRDGHTTIEIYYENVPGLPFSARADLSTLPIEQKPCGFPVEIADAIIRLLDIGGKFDINLDMLEEPPYMRDSDTIDDWLLAICGSISQAGYHKPSESDFEIYICEALAGLFLICEKLEIHIMEVIQAKLAYNRTRPPKHGRQF